jgi:outer membrane protein OmpA-like peptidoglycan-associated protein
MGDQLDRALREGADARSENRQLKAENQRLRDEFDRANRDLAEARSTVAELQSQNTTASARLSEIDRAERERQQAEARRRDFGTLQAAVSALVKVRPSGSGFIATLPDSFFVPNQAALALRVKAKIDQLARVIAGNPDAAFTIEGHSDARATADSFALGRAQSVAEYIAALGVSRTNFRVESRGASVPISRARTVAAKASNRRVELVFVGPQ